MLPALSNDGFLGAGYRHARSAAAGWAHLIHSVSVFVAKKIHGFLLMYIPDWLSALVLLPLFCMSMVGAYVYGISRTLPDLSTGMLEFPPQSVQVVDRNGGILYTAFQNEDRLIASHTAIPDTLRHAVVAVEDKRFFERGGCIDVRAILRAALANVQEYKSQGASTITQQLARTVFLSREKLIDRKIRELLLACRIEQVYTKDEILDMYLNWISFGGTLHGVTQASTAFFGIDPLQLSTAQSAILASLPQRPTYFSPYGAHRTSAIDPSWSLAAASGSFVDGVIPDDAVIVGLTGTAAIIGGQEIFVGGRANMALQKMAEQGYITHEERLAAEEELNSISFLPSNHSIKAPYYALHALQALMPDIEDIAPLAAQRGGLRIQTTIDPALQSSVESFVASHAQRIRDKYQAAHIAALLTDRKTGEILAYVGNTNFFDTATGSRIDMIRSPRQPGSSFKPIVYAYATEYRGLRPYTVVHDRPLTINGYTPSNYDGQYKGDMSVLYALNESRNIPAIETYRQIDNEDSLLRFTAALGAGTPLLRKQQWQESGLDDSYGWPLAIGAAETPLWEMVEAYATMANDGLRRPLHGVRTVLSSEGETLYQADTSYTRVLSSTTANIMTSMLSDSLSKPAGYWRSMMTLPGIDAAVKTGTSNVCAKRDSGRCALRLPRDLWTIGYTPSYVLGVWVGNADGTPLAPSANGLEAAVPLWRDILLAAHSTKQSDVRFAGESEPYQRRTARTGASGLSVRSLTLRRAR